MRPRPEDFTPEDLDARADHIVAQCNGIFPAYEAFYIQSIMYSADRCLESFERYDTRKREGAPGPDQVSAVHEALGHAASLSRYFWTSGAGPKVSPSIKRLKEARAAKLRDAFSMTDESPLKDRALRDALEHFDERVDRYLLTSDAGQYMPVPRIGDSDGVMETSHIFKMVDPDQEVFVVLGKSFGFQSIREETARVLLEARRMDRSGARLRRADNT